MHRLSTEIVDREGKNGSLCGYLFLFLRKQFAEQKTDEGSAVHELPEESNWEVHEGCLEPYGNELGTCVFE